MTSLGPQRGSMSDHPEYMFLCQNATKTGPADSRRRQAIAPVTHRGDPFSPPHVHLGSPTRGTREHIAVRHRNGSGRRRNDNLIGTPAPWGGRDAHQHVEAIGRRPGTQMPTHPTAHNRSKRTPTRVRGDVVVPNRGRFESTSFAKSGADSEQLPAAAMAFKITPAPQDPHPVALIDAC